MKSSLFVGVDVSKATLDVTVLSPTYPTTTHYHPFSNDIKGFAQMLRWVKQHCSGITQPNWRICMENTGIYSLELNCFLQQKGIWQCLANSLEIKRSMGIVRSKTDKADSRMIAEYASRFFDKLRPYSLPAKSLQRLRILFAQREWLIDMHRGVQLALKSLQGYSKELTRDVRKQNEGLLKSLTAQIKVVDKALKECIKEDEVLHEKAKLIQSVPGVGLQTATYLLIVSRGMEAFETPRQFACYSGCAPFKHCSGTSIRGRTKVHYICNHKMKSLLHMAAMNAVTFNEELKTYYQRKLKEGKSPMSVLNAVRFKLICRIFSVVKRGEAYQKDFGKIAA